MKKLINIFKFILPIAIFSVLATSSLASIESPKYEGTCNPKSVTLSGNGVGEINVDNSRVNDANGIWSVDLPLKFGSHNLIVGGESLNFSIPKCAEGGGIIQQGSCLGLFGRFAKNCLANKAGIRFVSAGTENCPIWMSTGCLTNEPTAEEKAEQKLIESLQAKIVELTAQIAKLLASRR